MRRQKYSATGGRTGDRPQSLPALPAVHSNGRFGAVVGRTVPVHPARQWRRRTESVRIVARSRRPRRDGDPAVDRPVATGTARRTGRRLYQRVVGGRRRRAHRCPGHSGRPPAADDLHPDHRLRSSNTGTTRLLNRDRGSRIRRLRSGARPRRRRFCRAGSTLRDSRSSPYRASSLLPLRSA